MEFARTELPHSGLLTTVPDCPYALLHSEVVKQHFCSRWCRWCPRGCYCFHPDPLLFPGASACSVSGCTDSNVTAPERRGERTDVSCCRFPASRWHGLSHFVPRNGSCGMAAEQFRVKRDTEGAGMLPQGRSERRRVTASCPAGRNGTCHLWGCGG